MKKLLIAGLITAVSLIFLTTLTFRYWGGRLPTQVKLYLPEPVLAQITTPIPTALPAPAIAVQVTIAPLLTPTPQPSATNTAAPPLGTQSSALSIPPTPSPQPPAPTLTPTPSATPLPGTVFINNIVNMPQKFNNCGPANLTINLNHYGVEVGQLDVAALVKPHYDDRNVSPWELAGYVNEQTPLKAQVFHGGDLDTLKQLLAADFPVIIEKGLAHDGWMGHYLTIIGYDDAAQSFTTLDTYLGPWDSVGRSETYEFIAEMWQHFNYAFLIVYPPERETAVTEILGERYLDELQMWQNTAVRAQNAITENPDNAFAWFNLGSSLTHLARLTAEPTHSTNAAAAFDQARTIGLPWRMLWYQFEPYEAYLQNGRTDEVILLADAMLNNGGGLFVEETYLYKGLALQQMGKNEEAAVQFQRGLEINPNHDLLLSASSQN